MLEGTDHERASALREINLAFKRGELSSFEAEQERARVNAEFSARPELSAPKLVDGSKPWNPFERMMAKRQLPEHLRDKFRETENGTIERIDGAPMVQPTASKPQAKTSTRFPAGTAVVLGWTRSCREVDRTFTVSAVVTDPYREAFKLANKITRKGGFAVVGYRKAGYSVQYQIRDRKGDLVWTDQETPSNIVLNSRLAIAPHDGGERGREGLALVLHNGQGMRPDQIADLVMVFPKLGKFIPKASLDADEKNAIKAGKAECNKFPCRCPHHRQVDLSAQESEAGHPFAVRLQSGHLRVVRAQIKAEDHENHARLLVLDAYGTDAPVWVEYPEGETGKIVRIYRGQALHLLGEDEEDIRLENIRAEDEALFDMAGRSPDERRAMGLDDKRPEFDRSAYAEKIVKALNYSALEAGEQEAIDSVYGGEDEWKALHEAGQEALSEGKLKEWREAAEKRKRLTRKALPAERERIKAGTNNASDRARRSVERETRKLANVWAEARKANG
jgi:hypothetical protein